MAKFAASGEPLCQSLLPEELLDVVQHTHTFFTSFGARAAAPHTAVSHASRAAMDGCLGAFFISDLSTQSCSEV
jgi:hypothetical protein